MGTKHKHHDVIVAWAAGDEIELRSKNSSDWLPLTWSDPAWEDNMEYRVKPKLVKKEGWVNVYHNSITEYTSNYHATKKIADKRATSARVACIPIEWEEEE